MAEDINEIISKGDYEQTLSKKYYNRIMKRLKGLEILCLTIIALLVVLIIFNVVNLNANTNRSKQYISNDRILPVSISKLVANNTIKQVQAYYNNNEDSKLYDMFGDYAKTMVTYEEFNKSLVKFKALGKMLDAKYVNYNYWKTINGENWFVLNYNAIYEKGTGFAQITIKVNEEKWEIAGFFFNILNTSN